MMVYLSEDQALITLVEIKSTDALIFDIPAFWALSDKVCCKLSSLSCFTITQYLAYFTFCIPWLFLPFFPNPESKHGICYSKGPKLI